MYAATQNVFKYTQTHREIEVLTNTSYCFIVYVLAITSNTLLTGSCYTPQSLIPEIAFGTYLHLLLIMQSCKF